MGGDQDLVEIVMRYFFVKGRSKDDLFYSHGIDA